MKKIFEEYKATYNALKRGGYGPKYSLDDHHIFYIQKMTPYTEILEGPDREAYLRVAGERLVDSFPFKNMTIVAENIAVHYVVTDDAKSGYCMGNNSIFGEDGKRLMLIFLMDLLFRLSKKETTLVERKYETRGSGNRSKIRNIVDVYAKKTFNKEIYKNDPTAIFSHAWEVVGHWRVCGTIGKDRNGEYNQIGRTWVNPCTKGSGELVKKIRVIK